MKKILLKKIIKQLVKESLNEVLLESYIENLVTETINKNFESILKEREQPKQSFKDIIKENIVREDAARSEDFSSVELERKKMLQKTLGNKKENNDVMKEMFEDTLKNNRDLDSFGSGFTDQVVSNSEDDSGSWYK